MWIQFFYSQAKAEQEVALKQQIKEFEAEVEQIMNEVDMDALDKAAKKFGKGKMNGNSIVCFESSCKWCN